jgi:hypothetical protein
MLHCCNNNKPNLFDDSYAPGDLWLKGINPLPFCLMQVSDRWTFDARRPKTPPPEYANSAVSEHSLWGAMKFDYICAKHRWLHLSLLPVTFPMSQNTLFLFFFLLLSFLLSFILAFLFFFLDRVSLCSPGWPQTHSPPASAS